MDNILRLWYNDIRIVISVPIRFFGRFRRNKRYVVPYFVFGVRLAYTISGEKYNANLQFAEYHSGVSAAGV